MPNIFIPALAGSVEEVISRARANGEIINAHDLAEDIRQRHEAENIALEDIMKLLVQMAGPNLALELDGGSGATKQGFAAILTIEEKDAI